MDKQLEALADSQGKWSKTADALERTYQRVRGIVFALSTLGALLAAVSSQQAGGVRRTLAIVSAVCFAVVSFLTARLLDSRHSQGWARARTASEALKREAYKYAAQAAPYDDAATRSAKLRAEAQKIEADVDDLMGEEAAQGASSVPRDLISPAQYIENRVTNQIRNFYEPRSAQYQASARRLRWIEFTLALATTAITAIAGLAPKTITGNFDIVALAAVMTTLSGMILAYVEASRYDFTVSSYRAAARRLRDAQANPPPNAQPNTPEWSAYVQSCESILQEQNNSWIAKFGKPST